MAQTVIAKCENCGAALRVSQAKGGTVTCEYCGVESMVGGAPGAGGAPTVRIDKAPELTADDGPLYAAVVAGTLALGSGVSMLLFAREIGEVAAWGLPLAIFGVMAAAGYRQYRGFVAVVREHQWLRDNGLPARATVEHIRAGSGRHATLGLKIELTGQPERHIEHAATIPELLVPRLVDGLTLPVIVHPTEPDKIEVQWHLV
ncbi:MAG: hypothetical protein VB934_13105 [Polyangiaceae bacterium]